MFKFTTWCPKEKRMIYSLTDNNGLVIKDALSIEEKKKLSKFYRRKAEYKIINPIDKNHVVITNSKCIKYSR